MTPRLAERRAVACALRSAAAAAVVLLGGLVVAGAAQAKSSAQGQQIYDQVCVGCHQIGVLGAPKAGDSAVWEVRLAKGLDTLVGNALNGFGKMPPKGGNPNLVEADLRAAIRFMAGEEAIAKAAARGGGTPKAAVGVGAATAATAAAGDANARGADVVKRVCQGCHQIGVLGAPKIGIRADWAPRLKQGEDTLVQHATEGFKNMPPKGGNADLTAADLRAAIRYMISPPAEPGPKTPATATAVAGSAAASIAAPPAQPATLGAPPPTGANRFNRLLKPRSARNPAPPKDGIHDPTNDGTAVLQPPRQAFEPLPGSLAGNYVDWVKALQDGLIQPRWDLQDPSKQPLVMDLNIVREVKGSMPNVVYPHKQHLQWLDCSNCHPKIFQPKKGANQISMAEILLGRKCGVCHGKVAFPVSECRRCHSQKKTDIAKQ